MHLVYVDDSKDNRIACFSALIVPVDAWNDCLLHLNDLRKILQKTDEIYLRKEFHSTEWLGNKGIIGKHRVSIERRASIYNWLLAGIVRMPAVQLINAAVPRSQENRAFEWMLNRINVNMTKASSRCLIISDEGKSYDAMLRRMRRYNPISSRMGQWEGGASYKQIPIDRIVEDISYRDSGRSLFIQAADCCAYALLRRENPLSSKTRLGLDQSFFILEPIMVKRANGRDPYGIIR